MCVLCSLGVVSVFLSVLVLFHFLAIYLHDSVLFTFDTNVKFELFL